MIVRGDDRKKVGKLMSKARSRGSLQSCTIEPGVWVGLEVNLEENTSIH